MKKITKNKIKNSSSRSEFGNQVDFAQFTHPDGTLKGGVDVEVSNHKRHK